MTEPTDATGDTWERLQQAFDQLVDLPIEAQEEWIAGSDLPADLLQRLRNLLAADREDHDRIGRAIAQVVTTQGERPQQVGPWRLLHELGVGGMGAVYLAERADRTYEARVAVKFLRGALGAPDLQRRFATERQLLATLDHPGIARLIDGGAAPDGTPYFVMEYVDGLPVDAWCDEHHLDIRARVALVRQICDAVQHAHQALVVHRDLKPANILVTAEGTPKLLDFGIARLVDDSREGRELTFYQAMTPSYASPEQLRGSPMTTASDVWSLGVILYRLLTGTPPHALDGLLPAEIAHQVTTESVTPPSRRSGTRHPGHIDHDLDTVVLKALQVDATLRYATAAELAEDLRRWLDREPVLARRPTPAYRVKSFIRRHPIGSLATAVSVLALAALTATSLVQARRANRERDLAATRQATAEAATDELVNLFNLADPNVTAGEVITARGMLDRGAARVLNGEVSDPEVRSSLALALASVYRNLAAYDSAAPLLDTALAVRVRTHGVRSTPYAAVLHEMATLQYATGAYDSSAALDRHALEIQDAVAPGDHAVTEGALQGLGVALDELGALEESEQYHRRATEMARRVHGDSSIEVANDLLALAAVLRGQAKYDAAVPMLEESIAIATRVSGRRNLDVANGLNHLARTHSLAGRREAALPIVREAIEIQRSVHGRPHPETAASLGNLSGILASLGRLDEAQAAREESHAMLLALFGRSHPYVGASFTALGEMAIRREDWAKALDAFQEARSVHQATLPASSPDHGVSLTGIGRSLIGLGRVSEAVAPLRTAYRLRVAGRPSGHFQVAATGVVLGECLTRLRRPSEAEPYLREAVAIFDSTFGSADSRTRQAGERLEAALRALGRSVEADSLRARFQERP